MSKHNHNYSQYSNKNRNNQSNQQNKPKLEITMVKDVPKDTTVNVAMGHPDPVGEPGPMGAPGLELINETVETVALPETVEGFVVNCARLNVREKASTDSGIVCVLNSMSDIRVDVGKSNNKWVYVYTATGLEGYCMREYIDARL